MLSAAEQSSRIIEAFQREHPISMDQGLSPADRWQMNRLLDEFAAGWNAAMRSLGYASAQDMNN